jgi:hypothetical protein
LAAVEVEVVATLAPEVLLVLPEALQHSALHCLLVLVAAVVCQQQTQGRLQVARRL